MGLDMLNLIELSRLAKELTLWFSTMFWFMRQSPLKHCNLAKMMSVKKV